MGTEKRARQKANRQARLAQAQAEVTKETRERSFKRIGTFAGVIAAIVALFVLINVLTGDDDTSTAAQFAPTPVPEAEPTPTAEPELAESVPDDFVPFAGEGVLSGVVPAARNRIYEASPEMTIDIEKDYVAVLRTTAGEISFELFPDLAPVTVNNFVNLARDGFYDGVPFHRVLEGFMAQAGDPTGTGTGGPGYQFADEVDNGLVFDMPGQLAMANSGPDTNGSQFFITLDAPDWLDGDHTIFGHVARNEEVLDDIVRVDPDNPVSDQEPLTVIESVRIIES